MYFFKCTPLLFADDAKLFAKFHSANDCELIKKDIDALYLYLESDGACVMSGQQNILGRQFSLFYSDFMVILLNY